MNIVKPKKSRKNIKSNLDGVWTLIREFRDDFTVKDIRNNVKLHKSTIEGYIKFLYEYNYIYKGHKVRVSDCNYCYTYTLVNDVGICRPRGSRKLIFKKEVKLSSKIWAVIKVAKTFEYREVVLMAGASPAYVRQYLGALKKAKYIRTVQANCPDRPAVYRFINNTGLYAPIIKKDNSVYDLNLKKIMWSPEVKKAEGGQS